MQISRFRMLNESSVLLYGENFTITLRVRSRFPKIHRRQVILALLKLARPHFARLDAAMLCHDDSGILDFVKEMKRPVSLHQALGFHTPAGQEGFDIRLRRLAFGHSQTRFANVAEVNRGQLSRVEHGRITMSPYFRARVELAFKKLEGNGNRNAQLPKRLRGGGKGVDELRLST